MPRPRGSNLSSGSLEGLVEEIKNVAIASTSSSQSVQSCSRGIRSSGRSIGRELSVSPASNDGSGWQLPQSPTDIAKRRTQEFMSSISESPAKKRRLENVNKIMKLERTRKQLLNNIKKRKQRIKEQVAALQEDETSRANVDQQIAMLKAEAISDDDS
jgi:hypothetical protein